MEFKKEIKIYVSFSYDSDHGVNSRDEFTSTISSIIENVKNLISSSKVDFIIKVPDFTMYSVEQINKNLVESSIAIIDISTLSSKSIYEIGYLSSLKTPKILIGPRNFNASQFNLTNESIFTYENITDLINNFELRSQLTRIINKVIHSYSIIDDFFYKLWFPKDTQSIILVVPSEPEPEKPKDADLKSPNYSLMDNVGDKDAIVEVIKLLAKYYPKTNITISPTERFDAQNLRHNMVVIGGPGGGNPADGNIVSRKVMRKIHSQISYDSECEKMLYKDHIFEASFYDGIMEEDYGYFASFTNPFHSAYRTVLIHGIHTLGVVGAVKAFSDIKDAEANYETLLKKLDIRGNKAVSFESFFNVDIFNGEPMCPMINSEKIFLIGQQELLGESRTNEGTSTPVQNNPENPVDSQFLYNYIFNLCNTIAQDLPKYKNDTPILYNQFEGYRNKLEQLLVLFRNRLTTEEIEDIRREYNQINLEWSTKDR